MCITLNYWSLLSRATFLNLLKRIFHEDALIWS